MRKKVIILGAAGRDFHNYNVCFRDNSHYNVIAFTAAQIPDIEGRVYPAELAGDLYPDGIPIHAEEELETIIREHEIDIVYLSYSDISHNDVMHLASRVLATGAEFSFLSPYKTMLESSKPMISVCAVRTGCGKSPLTRYVGGCLREAGLSVAVVRHPMPYGDLSRQAVQRFKSYSDLDKHKCTIEEREEYEPLIDGGFSVYAGVDYVRILARVESEADVIIWDGGNNDTPFFKPDLSLVVFDPLRAGHEMLFHPGEVNARMADVAIIGKTDTADPQEIQKVCANISAMNPDAKILLGRNPVTIQSDEFIAGKKVLAVEDGPTITHGGMAYGAAAVAAQQAGAHLVDPKPFLNDGYTKLLEQYPHIGPVLPAMGYSKDQVEWLKKAVHAVECDLVLFGTPINPDRLFNVEKPYLRVKYEYEDVSSPTLRSLLADWVTRLDV
ncbi:MAG: cyclic 2,3-diphosphoglycerate synthase [Desulfovibrio sp.]